MARRRRKKEETKPEPVRDNPLMVRADETAPWHNPVKQSKAASRGFMVPKGTDPLTAELAYMVAQGGSYQGLTMFLAAIPDEGGIEKLNHAQSLVSGEPLPAGTTYDIPGFNPDGTVMFGVRAGFAPHAED